MLARSLATPTPTPLHKGEGNFETPDGEEENQTRRAARRERCARARRPRHRQQPDAARAVPAPSHDHAGTRRPQRGAEAVDPHRHELPVLRRRRDVVYGEVEAVKRMSAFWKAATESPRHV